MQQRVSKMVANEKGWKGVRNTRLAFPDHVRAVALSLEVVRERGKLEREAARLARVPVAVLHAHVERVPP